MPASCSAAGRCGPTTSTCAGSARCCYKNGVIEETGLAAGVLNHPATGVAWLANKIAPYDEQLNAGDIVLGGSFTRPTDGPCAATTSTSTTARSARSRSASSERVARPRGAAQKGHPSRSVRLRSTQFVIDFTNGSLLARRSLRVYAQ